MYFENAFNELLIAANTAVHSFQQVTSTHINFSFHEDAVRHLARLTRVLVSPTINFLNIFFYETKNLFFKSMNRSHALLVSLQPGLGRTSIVRFAAHLSKIKVNLLKNWSNLILISLQNTLVHWATHFARRKALWRISTGCVETMLPHIRPQEFPLCDLHQARKLLDANPRKAHYLYQNR